MKSALRESTTFKMILIPYFAVTYKFFTVETITVMEYAGAVAAILLIWLGREWKEAHYDK